MQKRVAFKFPFPNIPFLNKNSIKFFKLIKTNRGKQGLKDGTAPKNIFYVFPEYTALFRKVYRNI